MRWSGVEWGGAGVAAHGHQTFGFSKQPTVTCINTFFGFTPSCTVLLSFLFLTAYTHLGGRRGCGIKPAHIVPIGAAGATTAATTGW